MYASTVGGGAMTTVFKPQKKENAKTLRAAAKRPLTGRPMKRIAANDKA